MVYHGIPRITMVYYGTPWYTMVYHGLPRYTMVRSCGDTSGLYYGVPWYTCTMVYYSLPWYTMVYHVTTAMCKRHCRTMIYHGVHHAPWYTMDYHGVSWYTVVYQGVRWCIMVYHCTTTMCYDTVIYHSLYTMLTTRIACLLEIFILTLRSRA